MNNIYYMKYGKKDERLTEMIEKASLNAITYIKSILVASITVIFVVYFVKNAESLLITNFILLAYFVIVIWVESLHIQNQNKFFLGVDSIEE